MTAGVILSSQLVSSDLIAEFGQVVPCDLPLANKPLYHYQRQSLEAHCDIILVTLPTGYESTWVDQQILRCEIGLQLHEVISRVVDHLTESSDQVEKVIFNFGDTIQDIDSSENTIYTTQPPFRYPSWFSVDENQVFSGVFSSDLSRLKKLVDNCPTTAMLLAALCQNYRQRRAHNWFDFGSYSSFYFSRKRFQETRNFNSIQLNENSVLTKRSADIGKMFYEYYWLSQYSEHLPAHCPTPKNFKILSNEASYDLEYFPLPTLSDLLVFGRHNAAWWVNVLDECQKLLQNLRFAVPESTGKGNFYYLKFAERRERIHAEEFFVSEKFIQRQGVIAKFLDEKDNKLVGSHGDLCFSNMLYDVRSRTIKLIDPRGYMERRDGQSLKLPEYYDVFKIAHSIVGGYDKVIVNSNSEMIAYEFVGLMSEKFNVGKKVLYAGLSHLFFTMLPLHSDDASRQRAFLSLSNRFYADYSDCR